MIEIFGAGEERATWWWPGPYKALRELKPGAR